jgi:hypothetical protein
MTILQQLLKDGSVTVLFLNIFLLTPFVARLRAPIAAKLGEVLGSSLGAPEHTNRAVTVLTMVTKPRNEGSDQRHLLWVQIAALLYRNGSYLWLVW